MGFPVGYHDLLFPRLILHMLSVLGLIRKLITVFLRAVGLSHLIDVDFLEIDIDYPEQAESVPEPCSAAALVIRELLPVVKFSELVDPPESCAVCLYEFESGDEIRRLNNCRHIFHRSCLDRWMDHDQKTCPLCRTPFIADDMQEAFNERLWAVSGTSDFDGEYSPITSL